MNLLHSATVSLLFAASTLAAQTTGVPGVNNLTMMLPPSYAPVGGSTVSCSTFVTTGAVGVNTVAFHIDSPGATQTILMISPVGCVPTFFPFPTAAVGCAGPIAGGTNLWLSLVTGNGFPIFIAGGPRWNFNLGWPIPPVFVQGLIIHPCSPTGFKFSQAMGFQ